MGEIIIGDKVGYIVGTGVKNVQETLDMLKEEGIYGLYRTKKYKLLNKELLYGMYVLILTNIKLHREYPETKEDKVGTLVNYKGRELYTCDVTMVYDVMDLGQEHLHEFIGHVVLSYVNEYKVEYTIVPIDEETREARNIGKIRPSMDILSLLCFIRYYYGETGGDAEFIEAIRSVYEGFEDTDKSDDNTVENVYLLVEEFLHGIFSGAWKAEGNTGVGRKDDTIVNFTEQDISAILVYFKDHSFAKGFQRNRDRGLIKVTDL